jgi:hypothetical protein
VVAAASLRDEDERALMSGAMVDRPVRARERAVASVLTRGGYALAGHCLGGIKGESRQSRRHVCVVVLPSFDRWVCFTSAVS